MIALEQFPASAVTGPSLRLHPRDRICHLVLTPAIAAVGEPVGMATSGRV
jgi:hypothetical protein